MLDLEVRKRFKAACDHCRKHKVKCDRIRPLCGTCQKRNKECKYSRNDMATGKTKTFYDSAHKSVHIFSFKKLTEEISDEISNKTLLNFTPPLTPSLLSSSSIECNFSLSPRNHLGFPNQLQFSVSPMVSPSLSDPEPSIERMTCYLDQKLFQKLSNKYSLGKIKVQKHFVVNSLSNQSVYKNNVKILGLDYAPIYTQFAPNQSCLSEAFRNHLINLYFNQVNSFFPLISRKLFYKNFKTLDSMQSNFLLNAIYFVACPFLSLSPIYFKKCPFELAQYFHQQAMLYLDANIENPKIASLQALLLLYNGECSLVERFNSIQYQMIKDLGLHYNSYKCETFEEYQEVLDLIRCCYLQDKVCNFTRGRGFALSYQTLFLNLNIAERHSSDEVESFPGAFFCKFAFLETISLSKVFEDSISEFSSLPLKADGIDRFIEKYQRILNNIFLGLNNAFDKHDTNAFTAFSFLMFRLYFHMIYIFLFSLAIRSIKSSNHPAVSNLLYQSISSASSIIFLTESLQVDFFRFGPLLKMNTVLLAYTVHRLAESLSNENYSYLCGFGVERVALINIRNLTYRLGLLISKETSQKLIEEFASPFYYP